MQVDMYGRKRFVGWLGSHKLSPGGGLCQQWPTEIDFYITAPMHWVLLYKRGFRDEYGSGQKEKLVEAREIRRFKLVLDHLINKSSATKGKVRTEIVDI